ncbi:MAG: peptide chain release factor 1 [SAR202 cluster bacterium]|nr:peptide chain release factor 1 [SAR202 cluster bacterium]
MMQKLAAMEQRYEEIERQMADPSVAVNFSRIQELVKEHGALKTPAALYREYAQVDRDLKEAVALSRDDSDREMASMAKDEAARLQERKEQLEKEIRTALLPKDPNDEKNVIVEIRAGTGGDEAGLFAAELYRMYQRYAQRIGWKTELIDMSESGIGSIKEVIFMVKGQGAYSRLKHESGVHRVQRVPVTESSGRIHTSTATVAVLPEAEEVDVHIDPDDLRIDIFHAGGHGGQNVQKVATAVRIVHIPSGIVAICQDERSQLKNKEKAMAVLRSRVLAMETEKQQAEITQNRRAQVGTGERAEKARTYNFPQDRVTDHRAGYTRHSIPYVMDGDIDDLIEAMIEQEQAESLKAAGLA